MIIGSTRQPDERDIATVVWDALQVGRRAAVADLLEQTVRHVGDSVTEWVTRPGVRTLECRFCRAVLRELRLVRDHTFEIELVRWSLADGDRHGERCAAGVVAGLLRQRKVREHRRRRPEALPVYWELDPRVGDYHYDVPVRIWGEGFRRAKRLRVHFGEHRALRERIISDHELVAVQPCFSPSIVDVTVTLDRATMVAGRFYLPPPSPY